jgi:NNP family nitrate/nitrite transporter-like MFS transporter
MLFGFLFKSDSITYVQAFTYIGYAVIAVAAIIFVTRFYKQSVPNTDAVMAGSMA